LSVFEQEALRLPKPNYEYITTEEAARTVLSEIANYNVIELDSETTSLDPHKGKMSLLQIGVPNKAFVFDVRSDTEHSSINLELFKPLLTDNKILKLLQNAVFDMKYIKKHGGYYVNNIYDTMLVEQLFNLGLGWVKADLGTLVKRYTGITMDKEPRGTFADYGQTFEPFQIEYAANDVVVLNLIRNLQLPRVQQEGFENVCRLEFEFCKPMCEMELNGITFDVDKHRTILSDIEAARAKHAEKVSKLLSAVDDQRTLFGVSLINIDSNVQLLKALKKYGLELDSTDVNVLGKFKGIPVIDELLDYRKAQKFISTYGETLIAKINEITGRLHTEFRQMVSTGRMSSSSPNLQNIPKKQIYRSCYVAQEGHVLITADMSGAELRILGNLSADDIFVDCYARGIDLHTRTASEVFGIPFDHVTNKDRGAAKAINFGLCYGLSKFGLARRLKISENEADTMINNYFARYNGVKRLLDRAGKEAVMRRYSTTVSGRKRFYKLPEYGHPDFDKKKRAIEREGKNAIIQGANADTIKESMILAVNRLEERNMKSKLLLTVHDEIVVEAPYNEQEEARAIVSQSLIDGFGKYFSLIPMKTDALVGPCWLKSECEHREHDDAPSCGGTDMEWAPDKKYGTKIVCKKCGASQ
jgi:DNA polymerase I-like protein with 3'-5' exonuclease and polymerase domains